MNKVICSIREPISTDENKFILAMQHSQALHHPWVAAPKTSEEFKSYFQRALQNNQKSFLVLNQTQDIVGVFNVNEIVHGFFQSGYLGFYAVSDHAGRGYMSAGLKLVLQHVFEKMGLHRLEANIQPANTLSINLVKNNGFRKEGYSPRYLKINDKWCDHERWAITYEDWTHCG